MARKKRRYILNSPISLLSTILLMFFVIPVVVLPFVNALGGFSEIITDLIELLPFGQAFYEIALLIINSMAGQVVNYHAIQGVFTLSYVIQELSEGIFTIIVYEALRLGVFLLMDLTDDNRGRWNKMKRLVVSVGMAIISACLAPALINWTFSNMQGLGTGLKVFFSSLISTILLGGGVAFFVFLQGFSLGMSIAFVALKFLLVGALRLSGSYIFLMMLLIGCEHHIWSLILSGMSGFLGIILLLVGIELMIDSVFGT